MLQVQRSISRVAVARVRPRVGSRAQPADDKGSGVVIDVSGPEGRHVSDRASDRARRRCRSRKEIAQVESFDLSVAGVFKVLDPQSFLADLKTEGLGIEPQKWKDVGAYGVDQVQGVTGDSIEFRLYEVSKGNDAVADEDVQARRHRHADDRPQLVQRGRQVLHGRARLLRLEDRVHREGQGHERDHARWTSTARTPTRSRTTARRTSCRRGRRRGGQIAYTTLHARRTRTSTSRRRAAAGRRRSAASAA